MKINIFKRKNIFDKLVKHNAELLRVYDIHKESGNEISDICKQTHDGKSTWWFNPRLAGKLDIPDRRGNLKCSLDKTLNKLFKLTQQQLLPDGDNYVLPMFVPNYLTLLLINLFYPNKKDILIEDACAGMGRLIFYLSKYDYTNFSIIEDFSQVTKSLMKEILVGINYILNDFSTNPIVINIAGYPNYPKNHIPNSVELFCSYGNERLLKTVKKMLGKNYVELCTDNNMTAKAFCRKDKYDKFYNIIKPLEVKYYD